MGCSGDYRCPFRAWSMDEELLLSIPYVLEEPLCCLPASLHLVECQVERNAFAKAKIIVAVSEKISEELQVLACQAARYV